jgi:peroxiredoxin
MKKRITIITFLLLSSLCVFGQDTEENITTWYNSLKSANKAADKELYLLKLLELKPESVQPQQHFLIEVSIQMVATSFAEEANFTKAMDYAQKLKDAELKIGTDIAIGEAFIAKKKYQDAHSLLDDKIANMPIDDLGNKLPGKNQMLITLTYGELLFAESNYSEALKFLYPSLNMPKYGEKYKEDYVRALIKVNLKNTDKKIISEVYLAEGKRSEAFKTDVKEWFVKIDANDTAYRELEHKKNEKEKAHLEAALAKMEVNLPAPDFEILDMRGNKVSLASLRGKTVILDFWATWCQPCVASFPGMQKAVNYFKNDASVVFMFIHTFEKKGADVHKQINDLLKVKGYQLDVYLDLKDATNGKSPVAEKFNIHGIPAKFVINKKGVIKYSNTGYISEDEAVDEIKLMIEKSNQ